MSSYTEDRIVWIESIHTQIARLLGMSHDVASRKDDLGTKLGFEDFAGRFVEVQDWLKRIDVGSLEKLPYKILKDLYSTMVGLGQTIDSILKWDPQANSSPEAHADQSRRSIEDLNTYEERLGAVLGPMMALKQEAPVNQDILAKLNEFEQQGNESLARIRTTVASTDSLIATLQEASGYKAISVHSKAFQDLAEKHASASTWSLIIAMLSLICLLIFIISSRNLPSLNPQDARDFAGIYHTASISILFLSIAIVAVKNFSAERHNRIVNQHRATALNTYEAFVGGTGDPRIKDAILLQASNAVFCHQPTGFQKAPIEIQTLPLGLLGASSKDND